MSATTTARRPSVWKYHPTSLEGKRVIVTGGTTGSGRSITLLLASLGARVMFFGRHDVTLQEALADLEAVRSNVYGLRADASREDDLDAVFAAADEQLGGLDILVNNAGLPAKSVTNEEPVEYRHVIETNLIGYMSAAKRAVERMKGHGGRIVCIGSLSAESRGADSDVYVATKSALRGFCDALGAKVCQDNIHVTLIEPGTFGADFRVESEAEQKQKEQAGELLFSEAIAEMVHAVVTTPTNCHVPFLQVQPIHQD